VGRKMLVFVAVTVEGSAGRVVAGEGIGEGSIKRMRLKMGCGRGLGYAGKSESPNLAAVAKEGMVITKIAV
jgi:hypothetical protein